MTESRTPLDSLKPLAGRALEAALNRALALDPDTRDGLRGLDGRRLVLRLATPPLALQIDVDGERLRVGPVAGEAEPDLSVRATLGGLLAQLPFMRRDDAPAVGKLRIEGDADLARRLQRLAERFDPDWQRPFVAAF
ncbi:MAG TPA: SCP2 sterol-binding domain-containing protein, partial [Lysobacter sp.]